MKNFDAMSVFTAFWVGLVLLESVLGVTLARTVFASDTTGDALLRGGALSLPLAVSGSIVAALIAESFHKLGQRTWIAVGLTILILGLLFVLLHDWVITGGTEVRLATAEAIDENGYYLTRHLWERCGPLALLLFPLLILTFVLDSLVLPFLPLFHLPFWGALAQLLLRVLGWLALGGGLGAGLSAGLLRLQRGTHQD